MDEQDLKLDGNAVAGLLSELFAFELTAARELGLRVEPFDFLDRLDLAIDGADQVDPAGWLMKGGGAAHTREKIVAAAAERFVAIVSSDKLVEALGPPVPLEL